MTTTFGTELVDKTNQAKVNACKARLDQAIKAAGDLESSVRWLVKERAWEVLGYPNLSDMWEAHAGHKCPTHVKAIAVDAMRHEGMNSVAGGPGGGIDGHTVGDVAEAIGLPTYPLRSGNVSSSTASGMIRQLESGVPPAQVRATGSSAVQNRVIQEHGTRARQHPRRSGASPTDLVSASVLVQRQDDDAVAEIARKADVPKAEIYRQAVAEYLMRHRESRPDAS